MNDSNPHSDLFALCEEYLDGNLNTEEANAFETRLSTDSELRQEFENVKAYIAAIESTGRAQDKDFLKGLESAIEDEAPQPKPIPFYRHVWFRVAAIILIISSTALFTLNWENSEDLYAAHYAPYKNYLTNVVRSNSNNTPDKLDEAMILYNEGKFK